jgi:hypothetical protein
MGDGGLSVISFFEPSTFTDTTREPHRIAIYAQKQICFKLSKIIFL